MLAHTFQDDLEYNENVVNSLYDSITFSSIQLNKTESRMWRLLLLIKKFCCMLISYNSFGNEKIEYNLNKRLVKFLSKMAKINLN